MQDQKRARKRTRPLLRALCIGIILFALVAVIVVYLFTQVPRHYHPLAPVAKEEVNPYLTHYLAPNFHNNIQLDQPFEVIVLQRELNEIIVDERSLGWSWPVYLDGVNVSAPSVVFVPKTIYLMATVDYAGFPVVVTFVVSPKLGPNGLLSLNLQKVKAGAIGITPLARFIGQRIIAAQIPQVERNQWLKDLEGALLRNDPFDPVFPIYQSDKAIRLTAVDVTHRKVVLNFAPAH
ncbi:MAG: hypothetical protein IH624_02290 [Phycisphaerae bacterium]|nr:hypothetical protein [Phycisphaerae bacterium]